MEIAMDWPEFRVFWSAYTVTVGALSSGAFSPLPKKGKKSVGLRAAAHPCCPFKAIDMRKMLSPVRVTAIFLLTGQPPSRPTPAEAKVVEVDPCLDDDGPMSS